ncbi:hypothetical protein GCM10010124_02210 [Pilimelia terevasa]|uniref:Head-to-tail adaptor n=1 Tax=Pilimelia terevasa TaxID=53372 RepID=A0A8J3FFK4_9ACTN|nr:hypothetical protein [Pilimelia terevasa]GGK13209.1 hypothetical protein GCM10010124_02210 [Pilimelia terevasa]
MEMEPYATIKELTGRLDWTLDDDELRIAGTALVDASDLARGYGRNWPVATVPALVRTLVLRSAARYMRNPDGYVTSRAGDEALTWSDLGAEAGTPYFTRPEKALLARLAGNHRLTSVPATAWQTKARPDDGTVPVAGGGKHFPMFHPEEHQR